MSFYEKLSAQEKRTIKIGMLAIGIIVLVFGITVPLGEKRESSREKLEKLSETLVEIEGMSKKYLELTKDLKSAESGRGSKESFTLFSFLDSAASDSGIKNYVKSMKPSSQIKNSYIESSVMVELEDVGVEGLTRFIHAIESSEYNINISKMDIRPRYSKPDLMSVILHVVSAELS